MSVHEIVARITVILYGCFLLWKLVAMVSGLSYRHKWVRIMDVIALSLVIGLSAMVQIVWKTLYHPGDAPLFSTFAACYFSLTAPNGSFYRPLLRHGQSMANNSQVAQ